MLSNYEIIKAFAAGKEAHNVNLHSNGNTLVNYYTTIAQRDAKGRFIFNGTKYSVSTSKIQTWVRGTIEIYKTVYSVPFNTRNILPYVKR